MESEKNELRPYTNTDGFRPYRLGKFNTELDAYVYEVSLLGCDDEISGEFSANWYGLMRNGRTIFCDHDPMLEPLNDTEREFLTNCAGVILYEDSQGFVYVHYYDSKNALERAWVNISEQYAD